LAWAAFDRTLAGAAGTPKQGIVGRQAAREAAGVLQQGLFLTLDALQQVEIDPVDLANRLQPVAGRVPDIGFRGLRIRRRR